MEPLLNRFEAYLLTEKRVSENTFAAYKRDLRQFSDFLYKKQATLESATVEQAKDFLFYLKKLDMSARTMARKISALKVFYTYAAMYAGWKNITEDLSFPKIEKRLPHYLTEHEIERLFAVADSDMSYLGMRNKVMLYLLYVSGMRISELTNLMIGQIQFDSRFITITGKGGKGRVVPIPEPMMVVLTHYVHEVLPHLLGKTNTKRKTEFLFPIYHSGRLKAITRQAFWGILKDLWKKTEIDKNISPHQLRHSLATHMLKNGVDLRSLQLLLGHENLSTVQIYTHLETGYLREVYDKKHPRA